MHTPFAMTTGGNTHNPHNIPEDVVSSKLSVMLTCKTRSQTLPLDWFGDENTKDQRRRSEGFSATQTTATATSPGDRRNGLRGNELLMNISA